MFKLSGILKSKSDPVQVSDKFKKRDFVVTDNTSMYPQDILFQLSQDKCDLIAGVQVGQTIEVSFNLRGREWTSPAGEVRYFNTLDAWKIEYTSTPPVPAQKMPERPSMDAANDEDDDLPF